MNIKLRIVSLDEKAQLAKLVNDYLKEHCRHQQKRIGPESVEGYVYFPEYWREKGRFPFFIEAGGETVGFVLVRTVFEENDSFYQVSDFYIEPEYQRQGVGCKSISLLWGAYPGRWELQVLAANVVARDFWSRCTAANATGSVTVVEVEEADGMRYQFNFRVPNPA